MQSKVTMDKRYIGTTWTDNKNNNVSSIHFSCNAATLKGWYWGKDNGKTYPATSNSEEIIIQKHNSQIFKLTQYIGKDKETLVLSAPTQS